MNFSIDPDEFAPLIEGHPHLDEIELTRDGVVPQQLRYRAPALVALLGRGRRHSGSSE